MFRVCICDDCAEDRKRLRAPIEQIFHEMRREYRLREYESGEKLYEALLANGKLTFDLLFLDIEMDGVNGLELRDKLIKNSQVWRIVFVSFHEESMAEAFGLKTVGFLCKPVEYAQVKKKISLVLNEYSENKFIELPSAQNRNSIYRMEQVAYFEADGNYSNIYLLGDDGKIAKSELICCKLIDIEEKCRSNNLLRIHKSYLVNMANVMNVAGEVVLSDSSVQLPVGRKYRDQVKEKYMEFILNKARERF